MSNASLNALNLLEADLGQFPEVTIRYDRKVMAAGMVQSHQEVAFGGAGTFQLAILYKESDEVIVTIPLSEVDGITIIDSIAQCGVDWWSNDGVLTRGEPWNHSYFPADDLGSEDDYGSWVDDPAPNEASDAWGWTPPR